MKLAALTIALLLGGTAIAQTTDTTTTDATTTSADQATMPDAGTAANGQWSNAATTTAPNATMAGGQMVAPGNDNPRRDARGIPVISAPAVAPAGYNGTMGTNTGMGGPALDASGQPMAASDNLPACSRNVTDHCVQTYERNRRR
jgi:hypothetical protein